MTGEALGFTQKRVRAYFAPVDRTSREATLFDPARDGRFTLDSPPAPWLDLGWALDFERTSGTVVKALQTGSPSMADVQVRTEMDAVVNLRFQSWGKLQLSLTAGTSQMNLLPVSQGAGPAGSGGVATAASMLLAGSTATVLALSATDASRFSGGDLVVVDADYASGTTGYVGAGVSGAYVRAPLQDVDYVRRVSLNVARVSSVSAGALTLAMPLPGGGPTPAMKVSPVLGFCDREGSTFFQEWSGLFVSEGQQGDRVVWHYPRLQSMSGIGEAIRQGPGRYTDVQLAGRFRALPVRDSVDGERVLCFRTYLPA